MAKTDPWNATDSQDDAVLDVMIDRLEMRGTYPPFVGMLNDYLDAMRIDEAGTVLDLGCGTGIASRAIARRSGFAGELTGIDLSEYLVRAARTLAEREGVSGRCTFLAGDSHALDLPDAGFDAVVAHTLFSHLTDPAQVLAEALRLVRPGGPIAVFDGDYASLTFELDDPAASGPADARFIAAVVAQPRVMRRMPRLARAAGLEIEAVLPGVITETGTGDFWLSGVQAFRKLGPSSGVATAAEADAWVGALEDASARGVFFGSSNYYAYILRRPR